MVLGLVLVLMVLVFAAATVAGGILHDSPSDYSMISTTWFQDTQNTCDMYIYQVYVRIYCHLYSMEDKRH